MEEYQFSQGKNLRCGYTTGSCATAAAKAAATMLLTGERVATVRIDTPKGVVLELEPLEVELAEQYVSCAIRKDSGDDPDDTNGVLVFAKVEKVAEPGVHIEGGVGVGRVTKPGLACAVGGPAINPTPRRMITAEVGSVMEQAGYSEGLLVTISIPEGVEIAKKTFNPRLGIIGGLSVLGTSGIVEPMSQQALLDSLQLEIHQAALRSRRLILAPGNYGLDYLAENLKELREIPVVKISNFIGDALDMAASEQFEQVLLVGHVGKLVKLAGGIMNTHSRQADCRTELFCTHAALCGADTVTCRALMDAATTDACLAVLDGAGLRGPVMASLLDAIQTHLDRRAAGAFTVGAVVFSNRSGPLGQTKNADTLLKMWKEG